MSLKLISLIGLGMAIIGVSYLFSKDSIFSKNPITIVIQGAALALMVWARITLGIRSFHAAANPTEGALVTHGPYHWLRHPIYASICYFFWASLIAFPYIDTLAAVLSITLGLWIRVLTEEKYLLDTYPEYSTYIKRTKRLVPFVF